MRPLPFAAAFLVSLLIWALILYVVLVVTR